jgi:hypothetical protein
MNVIAALGETTDTSRILKHTREEVLFNECARPWRRSPSWLLVRVTLQLLFSRKCAKMKYPHQMYKGFMVLLLSRILELVSSIETLRSFFLDYVIHHEDFLFSFPRFSI